MRQQDNEGAAELPVKGQQSRGKGLFKVNETTDGAVKAFKLVWIAESRRRKSHEVN